jgi:UDP-N-acetylmuramate dehydrogenase
MTDTLRQFFGKINIEAGPRFGEALSGHTTMRIGGPADAWVAPTDRDDFIRLLLSAREEDIPLFVMGGGANLLVGDRGIRGIVASTENLRTCGLRAGCLEIDAGLSMDEVCLEALARGYEGFENFAGMPGSLGGAIFMNARCYDREIADLSPLVFAAGPSGELTWHAFDPSGWGYKRSPFQAEGESAGRLILGARFPLRCGDPSQVARVMRERHGDRLRKGHYRLPCAGSIFKNDRSFGMPTGMLLDALGFRGRERGKAKVSDWHANIFVNTGGASAIDMRSLIEMAQREVRENYGFELEPEVMMAGEF